MRILSEDEAGKQIVPQGSGKQEGVKSVEALKG